MLEYQWQGVTADDILKLFIERFNIKTELYVGLNLRRRFNQRKQPLRTINKAMCLALVGRLKNSNIST